MSKRCQDEEIESDPQHAHSHQQVRRRYHDQDPAAKYHTERHDCS